MKAEASKSNVQSVRPPRKGTRAGVVKVKPGCAKRAAEREAKGQTAPDASSEAPGRGWHHEKRANGPNMPGERAGGSWRSAQVQWTCGVAPSSPIATFAAMISKRGPFAAEEKEAEIFPLDEDLPDRDCCGRGARFAYFYPGDHGDSVQWNHETR